MIPHIIFEYPVLIREGHLDTFGHVNNASYLQILEEARWEIASQRGYGLDRVRETGQGPVLLELYMRFIKELLLRDQVVVRTQLQTVSGKIFTFKQWIVNGKSEVACEVDLKVGLFDVKSRRLVEPTTAWLNAIGAV